VITGADHPASNPYKETQIKLVAILPEVTSNVVVVEDEDTFRMWSNTSNWPNGQLPQAGEYVEIPSGWKMILDIAETPILQMLTVNGKLYFAGDKDVHLKAYHINVKVGELHIGTETEPHPRNA